MTTSPATRSARERGTSTTSERELPELEDAARTVLINGEARSTTVATLATLLAEAGYGGARVATAINGVFVPERIRAQTQLRDGDQIEIVAPRQGG